MTSGSGDELDRPRRAIRFLNPVVWIIPMLRRRYLFPIAIVLAFAGAPALLAQVRDTRAVRLAVARYLNAAFRLEPQFRERRVVFDTALVTTAYNDDLHAEQREPALRSAAEISELALRLGGSVATPKDLPTCPVRYRVCTPKDGMAVQIGEPTFLGDSAFVVYRIARAMGGAGPYIRTDQYLVALTHDGATWTVTTQWPANMTKLGQPTVVGRRGG